MLRRSAILFTSAIMRGRPAKCASGNSLRAFSSLVDVDQKLRSDIKNLGATLGQVMNSKDKSVFDAVEKLRHLGREWRAQNCEGNQLDEMVQLVRGYDTKVLLGASRGFSHFLALANAAETHHRVRRLRERLFSASSNSPLSPKEDSCAGSITHLQKKLGISNDEIFSALTKQTVEIVLTGA